MVTRVLLSIKPEFAEKIFSGEKKFEFRRAIFKDRSVKKVLVYASAPVQKVIGEFEIEEIVCQDIETLWKTTHRHAGITYEYFSGYFEGRKQGFAIKIKNLNRFSSAQCLKKDYNLVPPQSFVYVN
jgi:predicted transcriptional regulator